MTRAVLKMGPCSCLEVAISNHPGLTAALKQCAKAPFMPRMNRLISCDTVRAISSRPKGGQLGPGSCRNLCGRRSSPASVHSCALVLAAGLWRCD